MYENIIAIPFRNRGAHLEYFIKNTVPLLQEHLPNSRVVVIEQNAGKLFNRGMVLNVAFKEYENKTKYFFTHDVDINPTKKCIEEYYALSKKYYVSPENEGMYHRHIYYETVNLVLHMNIRMTNKLLKSRVPTKELLKLLL